MNLADKQPMPTENPKSHNTRLILEALFVVLFLVVVFVVFVWWYLGKVAEMQGPN